MFLGLYQGLNVFEITIFKGINVAIHLEGNLMSKLFISLDAIFCMKNLLKRCQNEQAQFFARMLPRDSGIFCLHDEKYRQELS